MRPGAENTVVSGEKCSAPSTSLPLDAAEALSDNTIGVATTQPDACRAAETVAGSCGWLLFNSCVHRGDSDSDMCPAIQKQSHIKCIRMQFLPVDAAVGAP